MPGWIAADGATRSRIVAAARQYLIDAQPLVGKWLGTSAYRRGDGIVTETGSEANAIVSANFARLLRSS
jgi:hypothetical protein